MGDELGRTQGGNNNAYNQDNETSWVDWERAAGFADLERFVGLLLELRHRHPVLSQPAWWGEDVRFFGVDGPADLGPHSRSLAWHVGDLYVMANAWWEPLTFAIQAPGAWRRVVDTSAARRRRPSQSASATTSAPEPSSSSSVDPIRVLGAVRVPEGRTPTAQHSGAS